MVVYGNYIVDAGNDITDILSSVVLSHRRSSSMTETDMSRTIDAVRRFHRFYGDRTRALEHGAPDGRFSQAEARIIVELALSEPTTATALRKALGIGAGHMSRMLARLHGDGTVEKRPSMEDRRSTLLALTAAGRSARSELDQIAQASVAQLVAPLVDQDRRRLVDAMDTIVTLLGGGAQPAAAYLLRPPCPGDMGWVVRQHGILYVNEFGWEDWFEGLTAEVVASFVQNQDPARERCWIAEKDGQNVGSVFCVRESDEVARLRMLLVGPEARGLGIGRRLVEECIRFAQQAGYHRLTLWTYDVLRAARRIYSDLGFKLVHQQPHSSFGGDMMEETWELEL